MRAGALLARRARAYTGLLATIVLLSAAVAAIIAGTIGYSQASAVSGAREALTTAAATDAGLQVRTRLADDPTAQDARARESIRRVFDGVPVEVTRSLRTEPLPLADREQELVVDAGDQIAGRIEVTSGQWPPQASTQQVPGALQVAAAEALDLGVGDTVTVGDPSSGEGTTVEITALWQPGGSAGEPGRAWFGDALTTEGTDGDARGPLLLREDAARALDTAPFVRWTILPDPAAVQPADFATLTRAEGELDTALGDDDAVAVRGLTVTGDLATTAADVDSNLQTARALGMVPLVLLVLVSLIALAQMARLLAQTRSTDVELLVARGASPRQATRWAGLEALVLALLGAGAGTGVALLVLQGLETGPQQAPTVWAAGLLIALGVLVVLTAVAGLQARSIARRSQADRSGRTRTTAALGTLVLTLAAATLSLWQLRRYGSPLVTTDEGTRTDLVAAAAPAAALVAVAVIGMALFGPVGRLVEEVAHRRRTVVPGLTARQVARRLPVYVVPVVLIVLAVGAATISSLYAGTSAQLRSSLSELRHGTDVRVDLAATSGIRVESQASSSATFAQLDGATAATSVLTGEATLGEQTATLTALPAEQLDTVGHTPPGSLDPDAVADALAPAPAAQRLPGIAIPEGAEELHLRLQASHRFSADNLQRIEELDAQLRETMDQAPTTYSPVPYSEDWVGRAVAQVDEIAVRLWVADSDGGLSPLDAGVLPVDLTDPRSRDDPTAPVSTSAVNTVALPGAGPYRVVGLDLDTTALGFAYELDLEATGLFVESGDGDQDLLPSASTEPWGAAGPLTSPAWQLVEPTEPLGFHAVVGGMGVPPQDETAATMRLLPGADYRPQDGSTPAGAAPSAEPAPPAGSAGADETAPVPVALSDTLAERLNLAVGDVLPMSHAGAQLQVEVVELVAAVPGSLDPLAILVDLPTLEHTLLQTRPSVAVPTQVWVATQGEPAQLASEARALAGDEATVTVTEGVAVTDAAASVRTVFWIASAGGVLLAVAGIAAVATALLRTRRSEVMVLRALGMPPRAQAAGRAGELLGVALASLLVGLGAGWAVSALTVPALARSTTAAGEAILPAPLVLEPGPWAALVATVLAGLVAVALLVAGRVRAQALDNEYREEIR